MFGLRSLDGESDRLTFERAPDATFPGVYNILLDPTESMYSDYPPDPVPSGLSLRRCPCCMNASGGVPSSRMTFQPDQVTSSKFMSVNRVETMVWNLHLAEPRTSA